MIHENTILTPHPKEFQRLVGNWENDYEKLNKQLDLANAGIMISEAPPEEDSSKQESTPIGFTTNR